MNQTPEENTTQPNPEKDNQATSAKTRKFSRIISEEKTEKVRQILCVIGLNIILTIPSGIPPLMPTAQLLTLSIQDAAALPEGQADAITQMQAAVGCFQRITPILITIIMVLRLISNWKKPEKKSWRPYTRNETRKALVSIADLFMLDFMFSEILRYPHGAAVTFITILMNLAITMAIYQTYLLPPILKSKAKS